MSDGLPSHEVYASLQDDEGYMWFATDRGLARFNGRNFTIFSFEDGIRDITIFDLVKDPQGRIWFFSYCNDLYYYEKGQIHRHCLSDTLKRTPYIITGLEVLDDRILIALYHGSIIESDLECQETVKRTAPLETKGFIQAMQMGNVTISSQGSVFESLKGIHIMDSNLRTIDSIFLEEEFKARSSLVYSKIHENTRYFAGSGTVMVVQSNGQTRRLQLGVDINHAIFENNNHVWIGTRDGVYRCDLLNLNKAPEVFLRGYSITSINRDREGGYWFTTHNSGVLYVPVLEHYSFHQGNGLAIDRMDEIIGVGGFFYAGGFDGHIYRIDPASQTLESVAQIDSRIDRMYRLPDDKIAFSMGYCFDPGTQEVFKLSEKRMQLFIPPGEYFFHYQDNRSPIDLLEIETDRVVDRYDLPRLGYRDAVRASDGFLLGGRYGLARIRNDEVVIMDTLDPILGSRIHHLIPISESVQAAAILGGGILILQNDTVLCHLTEEDGLASNVVNQLHFDGASRLWVATNRGIGLITHPLSAEKRRINSYNTSDGLISDVVFDVAYTNGWIAAATDKGISLFKESSIPPPVDTIPIYVAHCKVNGISKDMEQMSSLTHRENSIQIGVDALSFKHLESMVLRYRLKGHSPWVVTYNDQFEFNLLPPGDYVLEMQAGDGRGWWSSSMASFQFSIRPPFWATRWFIITACISFVLILWLVIRFRVNYLKNKQMVISEMNLYQNQALASQLSPHFIYNCLGSVQALALQAQPQKLVQFISQFGNLLRSVFEMTFQNMVPLQAELDLLKRYLDIEKTRHKDRFQYRITMDDSLSQTECFLPPLLIQPVVENALKHGMMGLDNHHEGAIDIVAKRRNDTLILEVRDNGVGFEHEGHQMLEEGRPSGLSLVQKRLNLIKKWTGRETKLTLENITQGVRVTIMIPFFEAIPKT